MLTFLDQVANQNHLQIIKAAIPYLSPDFQKAVSVYAKMMELQNVLSFFDTAHNNLETCSINSQDATLTDMLNDIRSYCDETEANLIDRLLQTISAMELYSMFSQSSDSPVSASETI